MIFASWPNPYLDQQNKHCLKGLKISGATKIRWWIFCLSENRERILFDLKKKYTVCMIPLLRVLSIFSSISYLSFVHVDVSLLEKLSEFCMESLNWFKQTLTWYRLAVGSHTVTITKTLIFHTFYRMRRKTDKSFIGLIRWITSVAKCFILLSWKSCRLHWLFNCHCV